VYDTRALPQPRANLRALRDAELVVLADTIADARAYGTTDLCALRGAERVAPADITTDARAVSSTDTYFRPNIATDNYPRQHHACILCVRRRLVWVDL